MCNGFLDECKSYVDFIVQVEKSRNVRVLQLTDTQNINTDNKRYEKRAFGSFWASDKRTLNYHEYVGQIVYRYKPDFIIITGDLVYGEFDDDGGFFLEFIEFMDSFQIPWAPVFGNHDNESFMGVDWQCRQLENSKYCLFKQRRLTGNGNYSVGIVQGGKLKRVFYMVDSNGCYGMSQISLSNGHGKREVGFGEDQITWYTQSVLALKTKFPETKLSMAFHIQLNVFSKALRQYGFEVDLNKNERAKKAGDFGYIGRGLKSPWDCNEKVWKGLKRLGFDSIFVGHEHCNSASVTYEGVRLTYGQKSSTYDRYNAVINGKVQGDYYSSDTVEGIVGGTYFELSAKDGNIEDAGLFLYDKTWTGDWGKGEKIPVFPKVKKEVCVLPCENKLANFRGVPYVEYMLADFGLQTVELKSNQDLFIPFPEKNYAFLFQFSPQNFEGKFKIYGYAGERNDNGIQVVFEKTSILVGDALTLRDYRFETRKEYRVEVGFVNLHENGNTVCVFLKINGDLLEWKLVESYGLERGNIKFLAIENENDSFLIKNYEPS